MNITEEVTKLNTEGFTNINQSDIIQMLEWYNGEYDPMDGPDVWFFNSPSFGLICTTLDHKDWCEEYADENAIDGDVKELYWKLMDEKIEHGVIYTEIEIERMYFNHFQKGMDQYNEPDYIQINS